MFLITGNKRMHLMLHGDIVQNGILLILKRRL